MQAELIKLSALPSNEIQRLSASAIGKLAEFGADSERAVEVLAKLAMNGRHPQTRQYAIRALKKYGTAAHEHVHDLRDMARNASLRNYVRTAAQTAADAIELAAKDLETQVKHRSSESFKSGPISICRNWMSIPSIGASIRRSTRRACTRNRSFTSNRGSDLFLCIRGI